MGNRFKSLKEAIFGSPKVPEEIKKTAVAILGAVEQTYGIYQTPSFRDMITTFWHDPLLKEAISMFAEQVIATGAFLTANPKYSLKLDNKTALDVIRDWCDDNNIDIKLLEIAIELKAFGNSIWRISEEGFVKVPIEAVWRAIRIAKNIPIQLKYNLQLVPVYGQKIIPWEEFIHFKVNITGYRAPFGQGIIYGLLCKPVDSTGNVAPSIYDIRLGMRTSLHEGFRKFSFGNELWVFEGMSNEDFESTKIGEKISKMSSTGNRIATNARGQIHLAVPERTQSYDEFIKQMRDEFFMSLADPSLKLGLEQGFTKATSVTASEIYKYKIAAMRRCIKQQFEDLFKEILNKLGYDGREAQVQLNFGPEETAKYEIKDIFSAEKQGIILKNEARKLLASYHKWDITGDIEGGENPTKPKETKFGPIPLGSKPGGAKKVKEAIIELNPTAPQTVIEITELPDSMAGRNPDLSKIYIDSLVPDWMHKPLIAREQFINLLLKNEKSLKEASKLAIRYEKTIAQKLGIDWKKYQKTRKELLPNIKARISKGPKDLVKNG